MPCFILVRLFDKMPARHIFHNHALKAGDAVTTIEGKVNGLDWGHHGTHTLADDQNMWIFCPDMKSQKAGEIFTPGDLEGETVHPRLRKVRFDLSLLPIDFHDRMAKNYRISLRRPKSEMEAEAEVEAWIETHRIQHPGKKSRVYEERKAEALESEPIVDRPYKEIHDEYIKKTGFPRCTRDELLAALVDVPPIPNLLDVQNDDDLSVG